MKLIRKRNKDGIAMIKNKGFMTPFNVMYRWAKNEALNKIGHSMKIYNYKFTVGDPLPEVLFLTPDSSSPSHVYRVENHIINFRKLGYPSSWVNMHDEIAINQCLPSAKVLYIWRLGITGNESWIKYAKDNSKIIVFDTDDLTFEKESYNIQNVDGLKFVSQNTLKHLTGTFIEQQVALIKISDLAIGSTKRIAEGLKKLNINSKILPNLAPEYMLPNELQLAIRNELPRQKIIGYASGSNTHRKDFELTAPFLFRFLIENPDWKFECLGFLPIDKKVIPSRILKQISIKPLVDQNQLLKAMQYWDISLAPLQMNNPFTEAKSALKFIHASLVGAITIASPTEPFREMIINSEDGFLANSPEEWYSIMQYISENPKAQIEIARKAHEKVSEKYLVSKGSHYYIDLINDFERIKTVNKKESTLNKGVLLLLNDALLFSGGVRMAINLVQTNTEYFFTFLEDTSISNVKKFCDHYNVPIEKYIEEPKYNQYKFVVATFWKTAEYLQKIRFPISRTLYFIQDFEPFFYSVNESFLRAHSTYAKLSDNLIVLGNWNKGILENLLGIKPRHLLDLPVDLELYNFENRERIYDCLFFTRDDSERRLPNLTSEVLRRLQLLNPELKIGVFGTNSKKFDTGENVELLGEIPETSLPSLYNASKLGVTFSPTNTSRIPLEMAACGMKIIDIHGPFEELRYKAGFPVIFCDPNPDDIVKKIFGILNNTAESINITKDVLVFRSSCYSIEQFKNDTKNIWKKELRSSEN